MNCNPNCTSQAEDVVPDDGSIRKAAYIIVEPDVLKTIMLGNLHVQGNFGLTLELTLYWCFKDYE